MTDDSQAALTTFVFVLTLASGVWVNRAGKPYNSAIFTVHKLIALGTVISAAMTINQLRTGEATTLFLGIVLFAGFLTIALFVSGALLSIGKPDHMAVLAVHRVALVVATIAGAGAVYLIVTG